MKVYLVKHRGYALGPINMCAWATVEETPPNYIYVKSVQAFLRRRDAAGYIAKLPNNVGEQREIVVFSAHNRARTRRNSKVSGNTRRKPKERA